MYSQTRSITPSSASASYRPLQPVAGSGTSSNNHHHHGLSAGVQKIQRPLSAINPNTNNNNNGAGGITATRRNPTPTISHNKLQPTSAMNKIIVEERCQKKNERGERQVSIRKYYQERFLGKGGFAQCYLFRQVGNNKIYAAKIIDKQSLQKENVKQKLYSEIKIHNSLSHRHIVKFVRYFEDETNVYILLELCNCGSMMELMKNRQRLTEQEARFFLHQLLMACLYMGEQHVIHRDLKLGNLFLTDKMEIKIGDFGLATTVEYDGERKKTICGTPNYIAPEVLMNKGHSYEVDIWSIGVILYTMLVGTPPFETKDVKETYKKIKHNDYDFPEDLDISNKAKNLVRKILRRNPDDRPTVKEILMDPFFAGAPVDQCPPSLLEYARTHALKIGDMEENTIAAYSSKNPELQQQLQKLRQQERVPFRQIDNMLHQRPTTSDQTTTMGVSKQQHAMPIGSSFRPPLATVSVNNENVNPLPTQTTSTFTKPPSSHLHLHSHALTKTTTTHTSEVPSSTTTTSNNRYPTTTTERSNSAQPTHSVFAIPEYRQPVQTTSQTSRLPTPKRRSPSEEENKSKPRTPTTGTEASLDPPVKKSRTPSNAPISPSSGFSPTGLNMDPMPVDATAEDDLSSPVTLELPSVWISYWADFSSKYGLAYMLNNGSVGALFNDSTKILFNPTTEEVNYYERKISGETVYEEKTSFPITNFPQALQKKITLIKYFTGYLEKLKQNESELPPLSSSSDSGKSSYIPKEPLLPLTRAAEGIFVKRWLRTQHAIIFRLSNKAVQVCFFDQTEIILCGEANNVAFTTADGVRTCYALNKVIKNPSQEISKRLKYTKDVLCRLIGGSAPVAEKVSRPNE
ncbi:hypothetical protein FDP41_001347 [Naegleria fowleri]|uniref:Serine/threonine-protein kinase PLK n=1 Tax=Naegleria fowleri TaxID=5763 RepID=A0A6A5C319_NAEFO|nr:uncharacterized protein FDP41_001347 [Naegleria fowleri]KAF0979679.1 hypothetical protein FDP41_001347 [Naegleria fowleri]CAG4711169.1 unnamed protein product [Naegleria fowleri]